MRGFKEFRGTLLLLPALWALAVPTVARGQTAEELARIREMTARLEAQVQAMSQERQERIQEALARVREELAKLEYESQEARDARAQELERVREQVVVRMEEARARQEELVARQEELAAHQHQLQAEVMARAREAQELQVETRARQERAQRELQAREEELRVRLAQASEEHRAQAREVAEQARQEYQRARQLVVRVRSRMRLGVSLDGNQGEEYDRRGARIQSVIDGTPAQEAGLREGDIITHLNGHSLLEPLPDEGEEGFLEDQSLPVQRLLRLAGDLEAGEQVEIRYFRDGTAGTATFEAADIEEPSISAFRFDPQDPSAAGILRFSPGDRGSWTLRSPGESTFAFRLSSDVSAFGLDLAPMNPGLAEYFSEDEGVLILNVDEDSTLGLLPGDVLKAIDGRAVEEPGDVARILRSYQEDESIGFTVVRKGEERSVRGTIR